MMCPICGSQNVTVQAVTETSLRIKKRGDLCRLVVGTYKMDLLFRTGTFHQDFSSKKLPNKIQA